MQPAETWSLFEAAQNAALMAGLCLVTESPGDVAVPVTKEPDRHSRILEVSDRMYCSACSRAFESREDQIEHYRLDWHRFNLKQRLRGQQMLTVDEFEAKTQAGDVSSISGSDSSDSDTDSESELPSYPISEGKGSRHLSPSSQSRSQRVLFRNSQGQLISVYRCVLNAVKGSVEEPAELVASLQRQSPGTCWVILMAGGGHFAGAVFKGKELLEHKTFHRYTVRARRGTSQGVRDAKGSKPKSAGASLRRYNEAALLKDIQELLSNWEKHLQGAERIFLRAPRTNRARFFGTKGPLEQDDTRIRGIPFSTRRATFHEVQRVHGTLSTLQVYGKDTPIADLVSSPQKSWKKAATQDKSSSQCQNSAAVVKSEEEEEEEEMVKQLELVELTLDTLELREFEVQPKCRQKRRKKKPKESCTEITGVEKPEAALSRRETSVQNQQWPEDQGESSHGVLGTSVQDALFTACKMGDVCALQQYLGMAADAGHKCNGVSTQQLLNAPLDESGWTFLHVAAAAGRSEVVRLLLEAGADPAVRDKQEQPPYCVSASKQTRNEFRRFMSEQPQKYNYTQAQVPGPLTAEMEARQAERRRAHKVQRKQREKEEREAQQLRAQEEDEKRRFAALSDREKCALAAERRLLSQLTESGTTLNNTRRCWLCGESLLGRIPFHYLDFSFCSTNCLRTHRQRKTATS